MEPPPTTAASSSSKLRLMCSYGGHIVPRPHAKSLFYSGGDTRIVSIPSSAAAALPSFTAAVSASLSVPAPFTLKYQLPGHDLDSLISLSSDDDLLALLDELPRLPPLSRVRLFLFPPKPSTHLAQSVLCHPKTEAWFNDALNSARMMQKGDNGGQNEGLSGGGGGAISGAESMVLETNSSFGSTSSSVSLTNLPSGKPQDEDNAANFPETRARLPLSDPALRDNRGMGAPSFTPSHQTVPVSGYPVQPLHHHFIPAGAMYAHHQQQPVFLMPTSSTQPMYQLQPPFYHHPNNPPYPFYLLPSNPTQAQPYGMSVQCGLAGPTGHTQSAVPSIPSPQEVGDASSPGHPCKNNPQQYAGLHQAQQVVQPLDLDQRETFSPRSEFDDDPAHVQIYKSQPPLPTLPSQYQTMNKAPTVLLSEAFAQLHTDGLGNQ